MTETGRFAVDLPEGWFAIELDPARRDAALRRLVDTWVARMPGLAAHRGVLVSTLAATAEHALATRCIFAAGSFGFVPEQGPSYAGLAVRLMPWPGEVGVDAFLAGMADAARSDPAVSEAVPAHVGGRQVLLVRQTVAADDGGAPSAVTSFVVPMPRDGVFANLEFTSPVAPAPEHTFAHIVATARVLR